MVTIHFTGRSPPFQEFESIVAGTQAAPRSEPAQFLPKTVALARLHPLSVRIDCEADLRRFPPLPRGTARFETRYDGRTAVERVNARLKIFWGVDDGNVSGARRFHAYVGAVMIVHAALGKWLAKQPRWEGTLSQTRVGPAALALARLEAREAEAACGDTDPQPVAT